MSTDSPDLLSSADDLFPPPASPSSTTNGPEASFDDFYSATFIPFVTVMAPQRAFADAESSKRFLKLGLFLAVETAAFIITILRSGSPDELWWFFGIVIAVSGLIGGHICLAPVRAFQARYKKEALIRVLGNFGTFDDPVAGDASSSFLQSSLIVPVGNIQKFDGRIHGVHRGVTIDIEEIRTYRRTERDGDRQSKTVPLFIGILLTVDFHKPFHGVTILRQERGWSRRYGSAGELETVSLEDPEFEKMFEVLSNDQVEARYLLTPDFMIRVVEFATAHRESASFTLDPFLLSNRVTRMQCSFVGSRLHVAIPSKNDLFELLHATNEAENREVTERVFREVRGMLAVVDALKIENR